MELPVHLNVTRGISNTFTLVWYAITHSLLKPQRPTEKDEYCGLLLSFTTWVYAGVTLLFMVYFVSCTNTSYKGCWVTRDWFRRGVPSGKVIRGVGAFLVQKILWLRCGLFALLHYVNNVTPNHTCNPFSFHASARLDTTLQSPNLKGYNGLVPLRFGLLLEIKHTKQSRSKCLSRPQNNTEVIIFLGLVLRVDQQGHWSKCSAVSEQQQLTCQWLTVACKSLGTPAQNVCYCD